MIHPPATGTPGVRRAAWQRLVHHRSYQQLEADHRAQTARLGAALRRVADLEANAALRDQVSRALHDDNRRLRTELDAANARADAAEAQRDAHAARLADLEAAIVEVRAIRLGEPEIPTLNGEAA